MVSFSLSRFFSKYFTHCLSTIVEFRSLIGERGVNLRPIPLDGPKTYLCLPVVGRESDLRGIGWE